MGLVGPMMAWLRLRAAASGAALTDSHLWTELGVHDRRLPLVHRHHVHHHRSCVALLSASGTPLPFLPAPRPPGASNWQRFHVKVFAVHGFRS